MASKRFEIDMGLNASDVAKGAKDAERALGKLEDAVEDTGRGGAKDLDKLEDELKDVQQQSAKTERAVKDIGDSGSKSFSKIKGDAQEVAQEVRQNLGEGIANAARGDFESLADTVGDTLGGITAGIGGVGSAALGVAGALGIGAIIGAINLANEEQQKLNESAANWAKAYEDSAGRIVSAASIVGAINEIATDPDQYKTAEENAKNWGVSVSDAMRAMAGDGTALEIVQGSLADQSTRLKDIYASMTVELDNGVTKRRALSAAEQELERQHKAGTEALDSQLRAMALGQERIENSAKGLYDFATAAGEATGEVDDLGNKIYRLPDGKEIVIDAETGTAYEDLDAIENYKLRDKSFRVTADTNDADRKIDALQRRLNQGINVAINATTRGRVWE